MDVAQQNELQVEVLEGLLLRDVQDLEQMESNNDNFSSRDRSVNIMMDRKVRSQRDKIAVKKRLINILKG